MHCKAETPVASQTGDRGWHWCEVDDPAHWWHKCGCGYIWPDQRARPPVIVELPAPPRRRQLLLDLVAGALGGLAMLAVLVAAGWVVFR